MSSCASPPFAGRAGLDRDALLDAVRDRLGRFFGKRGGAVVDANLAVIAAAYDGLIDVTAAVAASEPTEPTGTTPALEGAAPMTRLTAAPTVGDLMAIEPIVIRADASLDRGGRAHGSPARPRPARRRRCGIARRRPQQTDLVRARATEYLWVNWPGLAVRHLMTIPALTVHARRRSATPPGRWSGITSTGSSSSPTTTSACRSASSRRPTSSTR